MTTAIRVLALFLVTSTVCGTYAFVNPTAATTKTPLVVRQALWRHFVPRGDDALSFYEIRWEQREQHHDTVIRDKRAESPAGVDLGETQLTNNSYHKYMQRGVFASYLSLMVLTVLLPMTPANAVSGGGLDYANLDITGQDFSNGAYRGKDFTQVIAKGTNFAKSNLQGCRFYKAYLVNADFTGADLRGASLEDTSMDGASLKNANAAGAYFGQSLLDVGVLENADFTDAQVPLKTLPLVCERSDLKGTNPTTGADTRESLMCP